MPTLRQAKQIVAGSPVINPRSADALVSQLSEFIVPTGLALNDVIEMGAIPEGCVVVGAKVVSEDLDSNGTPTITLDAGILSGVYGKVDNARTCGNEFFAASTIGQTGGVQTDNKAAGLMLTPSLDLVPYGLKVAAAAATLTVGAKIRMSVTYRSAPIAM